MRHDHTPAHVNGAFLGVVAVAFLGCCAIVAGIGVLVFEGYVRVVVPW